MHCTNSKENNYNEVPKTQNASMAVLSPEDEKDFILRKAIIKAGGSMPNHTNEIQHQQYVTNGEGKVVIGDKTYHAKKGDFIYTCWIKSLL